MRVIADNLIQGMPFDETASPVKRWHAWRIYLNECIARFDKRLDSYRTRLAEFDTLQRQFEEENFVEYVKDLQKIHQIMRQHNPPVDPDAHPFLGPSDDSARKQRKHALEALWSQISHKYNEWENLKQKFDKWRSDAVVSQLGGTQRSFYL